MISQRLRALRLDRSAGDLAVFEPLIAVTGGKPKALEIVLGLIKHERLTKQQIVDDLAAAQDAVIRRLVRVCLVAAG